MQIGIVKDGAIRTFLKRVVNHTACRLTNADRRGAEIFKANKKVSSFKTCLGLLVAPY
jgi:hypothetical protein